MREDDRIGSPDLDDQGRPLQGVISAQTYIRRGPQAQEALGAEAGAGMFPGLCVPGGECVEGGERGVESGRSRLTWTLWAWEEFRF